MKSYNNIFHIQLACNNSEMLYIAITRKYHSVVEQNNYKRNFK